MVPHPKILAEEWQQDTKSVKAFKCVICAKQKLCMLLPDPMIMDSEPMAYKAGCIPVSAWCRPCYVRRDYITLS